MCGRRGLPPPGSLTGSAAEERGQWLDFTEHPRGLRRTAGLTDVREASRAGTRRGQGQMPSLPTVSHAFPVPADTVTGRAGHAGMGPDPRSDPGRPRSWGTRTTRSWLHLALLWQRGPDTETGEEEQSGEVQGACPGSSAAPLPPPLRAGGSLCLDPDSPLLHALTAQDGSEWLRLAQVWQQRCY